MTSAKTIIRNSVILGISLVLAGCSWFGIDSPTTSLHQVNLPPPLELRQVQWNVIQYDNVYYYALDDQNFTNLSLDMQEVQDRLYLYHSIIENQNKSFEN